MPGDRSRCTQISSATSRPLGSTTGTRRRCATSDALIWTPSRIEPTVAAGVRDHFTDDEALELTLDVMRNAANKIAVALGADAPRVAEGTERYLIDADGQTVYASA